MRVDDWPLDKIMLLPDWCFGRRLMYSCTINPTSLTWDWDISELAFPEIAVIWGFHFSANDGSILLDNLTLTLGDQLPTSVAMANRLEPMFPGWGVHGPEPRRIITSRFGTDSMFGLRYPIRANGRRMIFGGQCRSGSSIRCGIWVSVSGIPREVPDWMKW